MYESIILCINLEIALRVCAYRAYLRRFGAYDDMAAVPAFPDLHFTLFEDFLRFDVPKKRAIPFFMVLFDGGYLAEFLRKLREAFLFGGFGEAFVHISPFVILTVSCGSEIFGGIADAVQLFEPHFCVFFFIVGGFQEKR